MRINNIIPLLDWLPKTTKTTLRKDFFAGLTVAILLIPQGMAYAMLSGLPPIYGLYAGFVPVFLYAIFGTSRQLSVGPVAIVSLLVLSGLSQLATPGSSEFIALAIYTSLISGVIQLLIGSLGLGRIINFLSYPVISGFTTAAAVLIAMTQLKHLFGVELPSTNKVITIFSELGQQLSDVNPIALLIGVLGIAFLLIVRSYSRKIPAALIAVLIASFAVYLFNLDSSHQVTIIGEVKGGLPSFQIPMLDWETFKLLLPLSLTITLISFIESLAISRTIAKEHKSYKINASQELIALGISKIGGAFFQSYPTTGSFSRSAVNNSAGAQSGFSSFFTVIFVALILLFFTPILYYMPNCILAAIIIVSVIGLIKPKEILRLYTQYRYDFYAFLATFLFTLGVGIQEGIFAGAILSIGFILYKTSEPHMAVLGRLPQTTAYRNVHRFAEAIQDENLLIVRFDTQIYFGNADYFLSTIQQIVNEGDEDVDAFILDASSVHSIDSTGVEALRSVVELLRQKEIRFTITGLIGPMRDLFFKTGLMEYIGEQNHFMYVHDAVVNCTKLDPTGKKYWSESAVQTNITDEPN